MLLMAAAAMVLAGCSNEKKQEENKVAVVKVALAQSVDELSAWQFPCRVKAGSEVSVAFKVAGNVRRMAVKAGDRVQKGQLLAELDDSDYRVQLAATESEYAQIKADVERVVKLYEQGATTASNYDKARYGLQQIEAKLQHHRNQVEYCKIYAPESGTVHSRFFEGGETIGPGIPAVLLIGGDRPEVEITVPASVQRLLTHAKGQVTATAIFSAFGERVFDLRMLHVLPRANTSGMFPVRMAIEGADLPTPGMNGWVTITGGVAETVREVIVPTTSVAHKGDKDYVFRVENGRTKQIEVKVLSLTGDGKMRIVGDVDDDDMLVVSGVNHVADNQEVEVLKLASKTNVGALL